jgi:hypothetical protein
MASFTDTIRLTVSVVTGQATGSLKSLISEVSNAEGAWGKMKAAGAGAFDAIKANAATFALSAGTAIAAFGAKAVSDMQKVALGAGELRDKLGLTADEASRWQEVAGDLGISTEQLSRAMGLMLRTAGQTPGVFKDLGVQIAYAKDGTVDANGTFLNVIDALHKMSDPAQRAAAAQKLLGRSWQESAELIETGAAGVRDRLAEVAGAKIVSDAQIAQSRRMRDVMDNLHDSLEDVTLTVGESLIPAVSDAAETIGTVVGPLGEVIRKFQELQNLPVIKQIYENFAPWEQIPTRIKQVTGALRELFGTSGDFRDDTITSWAKETNAALAELGPTTAASKKATDDWLASQEVSPELARALGRSIEAQSTALDENADKTANAAHQLEGYKAALDFIESSADKAADASNDFADALDNVYGSATDVQGALDETAQNTADLQGLIDGAAEGADGFSTSLDNTTEAGRKNREQIRKTADGINDYISTLAASGATTEDVQGQYDMLRGQLYAQLRQFGLTEEAANSYIDQLGLTPKNVTTAIQQQGMQNAKDEVLDYLHNHLDEIPRSKLTEILGHLQRNEFDAAKELINSIPKIHYTDIVARVDPRFNAALGAITARGGRYAKGGRVGPGGGVGGEAGAELVELGGRQAIIDQPTSLPPGAMVTPLSDATSSGVRGGSGSVGNTYVTNHIRMPPGVDSQDFARALQRLVKYNGPAVVNRIIA